MAGFPIFIHEDTRFMQYFRRLESYISAYIKASIPSIFAPSIVWKPGSISSGNVFSTFQEVYDAAQSIEGYKIIYIDTSFAPAIVPQGSWDFSGYCVWQGKVKPNPSSIVNVSFDDGATLSGIYRFIELGLVSNSNSVIVSTPDYYFLEDSYIRADGIATASFFEPTGHGTTIVELINTIAQTGANNAPCFATILGGFTVKLSESSSLYDMTVRGGATGHPLAVSFQSPYASMSSNQGVNVITTIQNGRFGILQVGSDLNVANMRTYQVWLSISSPEGNVIGNIGDVLVWTNGVPGQVLWVKESNNGGVTGWVNK